MSETTTDPEDEYDAHGVSVVKKPKGHGSHRLTPPQAVREAVGMEPDEPWSWFYHDGTFWLRRAGVPLSGIPPEAANLGVSEARKNGSYIDFAIPPSTVRLAGLEKGDQFRVRVLGPHTMRLTEQPDE